MSNELTSFTTSSTRQAIDTLRSRLRGALIQPDDERYDEARTVYWGSVDRRPALIVRAADETDVIAAVDYARETGAPISVRSGGHGFAGHALADGGIVVDFSGMKAMRIDPVRRTARVQPGLTWIEYGRQAQAYGLATTSGDVGSVGVGGLVVGGGIGWMVRKYGLTIDHLLAVDIVTADGRLLRASEQQHPDLFWAVRGGGSNFGIITAFEFRLEPAGTILGGGVYYGADNAEQIIRAAADYAARAPDDLTVMIDVLRAPGLPLLAPHIPEERAEEPIVLVSLCYAGDLAEGERVVAPLRTLATPILDMIEPMPYTGMFGLYPGMVGLPADAVLSGSRLAVRSMFLEHLPDTAIDTIVAHTRQATGPFAMMQLRVLGGAMARVPAGETAFAHRDKRFMLAAIAEWQDPAEDDVQHAWARRFFEAMRPHASGVYVNFLQDEGEARVREAYARATLERLSAIKARYDPANLFRVNQNLPPAGAGATADERAA